MSNIIKTHEDVDLLHIFLDYIRSYGMSESLLRDLLDTFILKDDNGKLLSQYNIELEKSYIPGYDIFNNTIQISYPGFLEYVNKYYEDFLTWDSRLKISNDLKNYVYLFIILHELEHSYQNYVRLGLVPSPAKAVESLYKIVFDGMILSAGFEKNLDESIIEKVKRELGIKLFNIKFGYFAMERNANVETTDALRKLAALEDDKDIQVLFLEMWAQQAMMGYYFGGKGSIIQTAKILLQYDKLCGLDEIDNLSYQDKLRFGLPLTKDELRHFFDEFSPQEEQKKLLNFIFRL